MTEHVRRRKGGSGGASNKQLKKPKKSGEGKGVSWKCRCALLGAFCLLFPVFLCIAAWGLLDCPIDAIPYSFPPRPSLEGLLAPNEYLSKADHLFEGRVFGPESFAYREGLLYSGTYNGSIVVIDVKSLKIVKEVQLKKDVGSCGNFETEPICGRPLGLRFDADGRLIIADAYLGLLRLNITSGHLEYLISGGALVDGKPLTFINDVDITSDGTILFSDSSSKWQRRQFPLAFLEMSDDGRLLSYNPETKDIKVLIKGLHFANGVQCSKDGSYVLVAETSTSRIVRLYLRGKKSGQRETFLENLPGTPDNIRLSSDGNFWIGFGSVRRSEKFALFDFLGPLVWLRNLLARIPQSYLLPLFRIAPQHGLVVLVNDKGDILKSLHDPTGRVIESVSQVEEVGDKLFLGSYHANFIGKVNKP